MRPGGCVGASMTKIYHIAGSDVQPCDRAIAEVASILSAGGLALVPTETVYGLSVAVDACRAGTAHSGESQPLVNGSAVPAEGSGYRRIFSVKHRDLVQTVPWLVSGTKDLDRFGRDIDAATRALADAFWPGALTLIVSANERVPRFMQAADGTVALRCSASPVVAALIEACACPLATTSANTHGRPAPAAWGEIEPEVLQGVDAAIDAGETICRDASTIVTCTSGELAIVRHGALSDEDVIRVACAAGARVRASSRQ